MRRLTRKKWAGNGQDGVAGVKMAGTGREQTRFRSAKQGVASVCDAKCDAISADRVQLLAHAVMLVAGMKIPEQMRAAVLDWVIADLGEHPMPKPEGQGRGGPKPPPE